MTDKRDKKRRVRERMARTGESYMTALRHVTAQRASSTNTATGADQIDFVELDDLTAIANSFAISCRVVKYPSLADVDAREALASLCLLLGKTHDDRAFDLFRNVLLGNERPRIRLDHRVEDTLIFANRIRAGIGGITNGGHMLGLHVDTTTRSKRLVLFMLQLVPDFVAALRDPTLIIAAPDDMVGIATLGGRAAIRLRGAP